MVDSQYHTDCYSYLCNMQNGSVLYTEDRLQRSDRK